MRQIVEGFSATISSPAATGLRDIMLDSRLVGNQAEQVLQHLAPTLHCGKAWLVASHP